MVHLNKIELIGRVGSVNTQLICDSFVHRFSIGVDEVFRGPAGAALKTNWFNCTYWGECEKIEKGNDIHIEGRIVANSYPDSEGRSHTYYEVKVQKIW